jgi:HEAT repeat protein
VSRTALRQSTSILLLALVLSLAGCGRGNTPPDPAALVADLTSGDEKKSGEARLALISLGEPAAPALSSLLRNGEDDEQLLAATTLWGMGARASSAVPALADCLADPQAKLRVTCAMALENMGSAARDAVPALARAVRDPEKEVRQAAVKALGAIGPAASPALPALDRAVKRESWPEAEEAIVRIRGGSTGAPAGAGQ